MPKDHEKFTEEQVCAALEKAMTMSGAAEILGCARNTIYQYKEKYPKLQDAINEARDRLIDTAEAELTKNVEDGHPGSVFFTLSTIGKNRGYVKRVESTGADGGPIQTEAVEGRADSKFNDLTGDD